VIAVALGFSELIEPDLPVSKPNENETLPAVPNGEELFAIEMSSFAESAILTTSALAARFSVPLPLLLSKSAAPLAVPSAVMLFFPLRYMVGACMAMAPGVEAAMLP